MDVFTGVSDVEAEPLSGHFPGASKEQIAWLDSLPTIPQQRSLADLYSPLIPPDLSDVIWEDGQPLSGEFPVASKKDFTY
jgi:hypothetical protein